LKRIFNKKELQDYQTFIELFVANFEEIQNFVASFIALYILYMLSVITYPHFSYTRYPDSEVKPSEYNENLGIVKKSPEIWNLLEESIATIEKFLK